MEYRIDLAIVRLQIGKGRLVDESICRSSLVPDLIREMVLPRLRLDAHNQQ